jgi:hypothetical protein
LAAGFLFRGGTKKNRKAAENPTGRPVERTIHARPVDSGYAFQRA